MPCLQETSNTETSQVAFYGRANDATEKSSVWHPKNVLLITSAVFWLGVTVWGMLSMMAYVNDAGLQGPAPRQIPSRFSELGNGEKYTLILFAHPKCPCTRASIRQVSRIAATCGQRLVCYICLYQPQSEPQTWHQTDIWRESQYIPRCKVIVDFDGELALRCGAMTSGLTLLYRPNGDLGFQGGVTAGRGHEGDNRGSNAIVALVRKHQSGVHQSPVFGCPIQLP